MLFNNVCIRRHLYKAFTSLDLKLKNKLKNKQKILIRLLMMVQGQNIENSSFFAVEG